MEELGEKAKSSQWLPDPKWSGPHYLWPLYPITAFTAVIQVTWMFPKHHRWAPASGPLHLLLPLPEEISSSDICLADSVIPSILCPFVPSWVRPRLMSIFKNFTHCSINPIPNHPYSALLFFLEYHLLTCSLIYLQCLFKWFLCLSYPTRI